VLVLLISVIFRVNRAKILFRKTPRKFRYLDIRQRISLGNRWTRVSWGFLALTRGRNQVRTGSGWTDDGKRRDGLERIKGRKTVIFRIWPRTNNWQWMYTRPYQNTSKCSLGKNMAPRWGGSLIGRWKDEIIPTPKPIKLRASTVISFSNILMVDVSF